jgi:MOSC domain-containing protein YiiM
MRIRGRRGSEHGRIVGIYLAHEAAGRMRSVPEIEAEAGRGLVGDRYHAAAGTWSQGPDDHSPRRQVTLIESEAIDALRRDYELDVDPSDTRRNLVTEGIALNHLVGREFLVGSVRLRGLKLCEPCKHVEKVSGKTIRAPLVHRGGLNAEVLTSGVIAVGDAVVP